MKSSVFFKPDLGSYVRAALTSRSESGKSYELRDADTKLPDSIAAFKTAVMDELATQAACGVDTFIFSTFDTVCYNMLIHLCAANFIAFKRMEYDSLHKGYVEREKSIIVKMNIQFGA